MKIAMTVTMPMTPIANFLMNHTSCVTTFLKIRSAPLLDRGPMLILRYHPKRGRSGFYLQAYVAVAPHRLLQIISLGKSSSYAERLFGSAISVREAVLVFCL